MVFLINFSQIAVKESKTSALIVKEKEYLALISSLQKSLRMLNKKEQGSLTVIKEMTQTQKDLLEENEVSIELR